MTPATINDRLKNQMNRKTLFQMTSMFPNALNHWLLFLNKNPRYIYGRKYYEMYRDFENIDGISMLLELVNSAKKNVPYYDNICPNRTIDDVETFIESFPLIDKDIVLEEYDRFISRDINEKYYDEISTGGTSGRPLKFLVPKNRYIYEFSALHWLWGKVGYNFSPCAIVKNEKINDRTYVIDPIKKEFIFDGFKNDTSFYLSVYSVMKKYSIPFFISYTSNAVCLANVITNNNLDHSFLKGLISTSENFDEYQEAAIAKLHDVTHMNMYGHSEKLLLGGWCEASKRYHFYNQYGFAELVDENGKKVRNVGELGELVGTTIYNFGMPMIRYRTGDLAVLADSSCTACGHEGLSVSKIIGRWNGQRIYNSDGTFVTTTGLNLHSEHYNYIDGLQYYQKRKGELILRVIPGAGYDVEVEKDLVRTIKGNMADDSKVTVETVTALERHKNGKFLLLISDVK